MIASIFININTYYVQKIYIFPPGEKTTENHKNKK